MTEHFGGAAGNPSAGPTLNKNQANEPPEQEAQVVLAAMMKSPEKPLMSLIQELYPNPAGGFYAIITSSSLPEPLSRR